MTPEQLAQALQEQSEDLALLAAVGLITPEHAAYIAARLQARVRTTGDDHFTWQAGDVTWGTPQTAR